MSKPKIRRSTSKTSSSAAPYSDAKLENPSIDVIELEGEDSWALWEEAILEQETLHAVQVLLLSADPDPTPIS